MFKLLTPIPNNCYIACSGGVDSMVLLDFVLNGKKNPTALYFNHGTPHGQEAEDFLVRECKHKGVPLIIKHIQSIKTNEHSPEEFWRNERYKAFREIKNTILTAHHLGDAIEWWIFSSLHGCGKLIPVENGNVLRPLLATPKFSILNWAKNRNVNHINDPSNNSRKYMRNIIRHDIMPHALKVNPGLETVIKKKYMEFK